MDAGQSKEKWPEEKALEELTNEDNNNQTEESSGQASKEEYDKKGMALVNSFKEELITIFYKSQDSFEKQLSFISAGTLGLSIGFIKDIVQPFKSSSFKGLLGWGWGLLVLTLLLNCISHLLAARYANKAIKEINEGEYDPVKINHRNKIILRINWVTVFSMMAGIVLIITYIIYNILL